MIRSNYEQGLRALHISIIQMGGFVERAIEDSIKAFQNNDMELCEEIVRRDKEIDEIGKSIESKCLWLIAREQPVASDLRSITSALKMVTDMESIGDAAADIATLTMRIEDKNAFSGSEHIGQMADVAVSMVHDAVTAYVNSDLLLAGAVEKRDDEVDDLFNLIKQEISNVFKAEEQNTDNAIDYLLIAKYLERIADHAVNICEWVEFSQTGKHKNTRIF